ncbi:MAG: aminotransferase class I/II-fold pyridoxal phosphate-dependent enzyme [Steroidobacteraceae bacterium]
MASRISPGRILLTAGAGSGLIAVFTALFAAGDRIGLLRPGYPAYRNSLRALGREPVEIDCGADSGYRLDGARLAAVRTAARLVLASPNNPTGAMLDRTQLRAVADACRSRGARLISDEIYHSITYSAPAVCALQGGSRCGGGEQLLEAACRMTGWRLGWLVAPESCVAALEAHLMNFFLTPPSISQYAALAAFDVHELRGAVRTYGTQSPSPARGIAPPGTRAIGPAGRGVLPLRRCLPSHG